MGIFNNESRPYWALIPILIVLTGLMVWMASHMPPANLAPKGYSSVIVAFEFVMNQADVNDVLSPLTALQIDGLDMVNYIDFGYMVVYSSLLAGFFYITRNLKAKKYLNIGMALASCALFSDLFENFQLLDLTEMYRAQASNGYESVISNLIIFTWLKWGSLALAMTLAVPVLFRGGLLSKGVALLLSIPIVLLLACAIVQTPSIIDKFTTSIVLGFLALSIYIIAYRKPQTA